MNDTIWGTMQRGPKKPLLMLGNPSRGGLLDATRVDTSPDVKKELVRISEIAFARLREFDAVPYSETQILEGDQYFTGKISEILGLNIDEAAEAAQVEIPADTAESAATALTAAIDSARSSDLRLSLADVQNGRFVFYVVVVKDSEGNDVALVRKTTGLKIATENKFFMKYADKLARLSEPIFRIDYFFDFAIRNDDVAIWSSDNFIQLFADVEALAKAVPSFVGEIGTNLGVSLSKSITALMISAGGKSSRIAQQIRRISRLGYLKDVETSALEAYLTETSAIEHGITVKNGVVEVPELAVGPFLHLLEQRLWKGPFDGAVRQAQAFAQLSN